METLWGANSQITVLEKAAYCAMSDISLVRIRDIGPASRVTIPPGATVVDLTGKFVVPGIINAHGHVIANAEPELRQYALYGVTTPVSQGADASDVLVKTRLEQERGNLRGARVFTTLYRFDPNPAVATAEQARAKVDEVVGQGADFIKVWIEESYFRKSVAPERMDVLRNQVRQAQLKDPQTPLIRAGLQMNMINLKKLSDAGARIAFGTDSGGAPDRFFIQGYYEHREMELMVQSGLTPMQVIQAFSKGSSEALAIDKAFGTLAKGKVADLLVLEKNPLYNIANMRTIETIYLDGRKFE